MSEWKCWIISSVTVFRGKFLQTQCCKGETGTKRGEHLPSQEGLDGPYSVSGDVLERVGWASGRGDGGFPGTPSALTRHPPWPLCLLDPRVQGASETLYWLPFLELVYCGLRSS